MGTLNLIRACDNRESRVARVPPRKPMHQALDDFVEKLASLGSIEQFESALADFLSGYGFSRFAYLGGRLRPLINPAASYFVAPPICAFRYEEEWAARYEQQVYLHDDPVVAFCMHNSTPLVWSEHTRTEGAPDRQVQVMKEAYDFRLTQGLAVPIHGYQGEFGILSVSCQESEREFRKLIDAHTHIIHLAALHFHSALQAKLPSPVMAGEKPSLTAREIEVLQWIAHGKSSWDTSVILRISERTVKSHLEHAMRKLNVYNRTHAVTKALNMGMIYH